MAPWWLRVDAVWVVPVCSFHPLISPPTEIFSFLPQPEAQAGIQARIQEGTGAREDVRREGHKDAADDARQETFQLKPPPLGRCHKGGR